jgi:hypothetical protein
MGAARPVRDAAVSGDRRALLVAMRDRIADEIDSSATSARDLAALTRRLLEIVAEVNEMDKGSKGDAVANAVDTPDEPFGAA